MNHNNTKNKKGCTSSRRQLRKGTTVNIEEIIQHFIMEDLRGFLVTDEEGRILYEDEKSAFIDRANSNWTIACPPPREGQKAEEWDLTDSLHEKSFMVLTSTARLDGKLIQLHHLTDVSMYTHIYRHINEYSRLLQEETEHDPMTGLYNKGKFMDLARSLFRKQDAIAIYNLDVNNLKYMNDTYGYDAGDKLIKKAADSIHRVSARNIMGFRMGGDEFAMIGLHLSEEEAVHLLETWKKGLEELNQADDGITCVIACGMVYGKKEYDFDELMARADQLMYEDKKRKKDVLPAYAPEGGRPEASV